MLPAEVYKFLVEQVQPCFQFGSHELLSHSFSSHAEPFKNCFCQVSVSFVECLPRLSFLFLAYLAHLGATWTRLVCFLRTRARAGAEVEADTHHSGGVFL